MTTATPADAQAYLVGAGIASLSAAVLLIRDGGMAGKNIHVLEELPFTGGSMDGSGDPVAGYVSRGGRMLTDETYVCLWNLLEGIPTLTDDTMSVREEVREFNEKWPTEAKARIIGRDHTILDASDLGLTTKDRAELTRLLALPERFMSTRRIEDFFSPHFFDTNFWCMWRTTFAFQNWHSAIELKRYLLRFIQEFPRVHTLAGVRRTRLNQYDSIIAPVQAWLTARGVSIEHGVRVTDVDFTEDDGVRRATRIHYRRDDIPGSYEVGAQDYAFVTLGSMTADATAGGNDHAPEQVTDKRDGGWRLWEAISPKAADFGRPNTFSGNIEESRWESFTLTMHSPLLLQRIEEWTGNAPGAGALMTFKDSGWLMSIVVPHQPHFENQPDDVYTLWGYGLFLDKKGDYVDKTLPEASGREILTELLGQLGFSDIEDSVQSSTTIIPVMMPYITSQFERRETRDRPLVVPRGSVNFAFLGQFTEIPEDVVFTVEYSVRGAMHAVYELLDIDKDIPEIYHGLSDPRAALTALKTAFS
ncbi:oleate hydratase [Amycolatopsis sp. H20-H5]|uniref:oleate hydratase n=1 Tax=Amycolatopsis sp. H20-H5 TaxID=3046309 RepID=UPI002DBFF1F9|nr:oleate hydratase [Amycolatopsis sp. H20-H5]MEC3981671.1 oleate hydratase [Amycolatopsis sp. H20-H5]